MRIVKKIIRKLYHLIWFLSVFFIFCPFVFAVDGQINGSIYSSDISASAQAQWYDVNHSSITTDIIQQPTYSPYFRAPSRYNSYLSFNIYSNLQTNVLYSLTVYLNDSGNSNLTAWNNAIATSTYLGGANSNNQNGTCRVDVYNLVDSYNIKYNININEDGTSETKTGAYYITFKPTCRGNYLNIPVAFSASPGYMYFYGYHLDVLGLTDGLTSSDIQSVINSSGLATANSVNEVKQGVNEVKQELSNLEESERQNAEDIMDNQNSNTDKEIESQKVCSVYDKAQAKTTGRSLTNSGNLVDNPAFSTSDFLKIDSNVIITPLSVRSSNPYYCLYDINKSVISCSNTYQLNQEITLPSNVSYFRYSIQSTENKPTFKICKNGNQSLDDSINGLNDSITDNSVDSSDDTINNLKDKIPTNSVISDLLLLPVRFLQNFVNALSSSCSTFSLGSLYGTELFMPCINIENYLGSAIWTTIDLILSGFFVYTLRKKFIEIYENLTNLKNGGNEVD